MTIRLTLCRIAGFYRITLIYAKMVSFIKFLLSIVGLLGDGREELRGVGELRAIELSLKLRLNVKLPDLFHCCCICLKFSPPLPIRIPGFMPAGSSTVSLVYAEAVGSLLLLPYGLAMSCESMP